MKVQHPLDWKLPRKPVRRDVAPYGRSIFAPVGRRNARSIQIEVGNWRQHTGGIGAMLGRSPSSISREIKRNTWFPSNENESYRPYRPKRLKAGPWTGRYYIAGPAQRKADRRRSKPRKPYRLSHDRLWAQVAEWLGSRLGAPAAHSAAGCGVLWPDDALMRVCPADHRTDGSTPAGRFGKRWASVPAARAQAAPPVHGGRRTSRFQRSRSGLGVDPSR